MVRILILGGTAPAFELAQVLTELGFTVVTSLAGRTQAPRTPAGAVRVGGFGGVEGLVSYLKQEAIAALIDATHPFAARISEQAAIACQMVSIPRLMLVVPAWEAQENDRWVSIPSLAQAAAILPSMAQRVFLTIGRQEVATFAPLRNLWFLMRLLEAAPEGERLPPGEIIYARPPFTVEQERHWMEHYQVDTLVSKNSGGTSTYAKIQAARELGLAVVMVERPALPEGDRASTVSEAVQWTKNFIQ